MSRDPLPCPFPLGSPGESRVSRPESPSNALSESEDTCPCPTLPRRTLTRTPKPQFKTLPGRGHLPSSTPPRTLTPPLSDTQTESGNTFSCLIPARTLAPHLTPTPSRVSVPPSRADTATTSRHPLSCQGRLRTPRLCTSSDTPVGTAYPLPCPTPPQATTPPPRMKTPTASTHNVLCPTPPLSETPIRAGHPVSYETTPRDTTTSPLIYTSTGSQVPFPCRTHPPLSETPTRSQCPSTRLTSQ